MERNVPTAVVETRLNCRSLCNKGAFFKYSNFSDYSVPVCMCSVELWFFRLVFLFLFFFL